MAKTQMWRLVNKDGDLLGIRWEISCPGCKYSHIFTTEVTDLGRENEPNQPVWIFNGDIDKPTFRASMLVRYTTDKENVCHSFVTDGKIQFLDDCTHELRGRTVELPELIDGD